MQSKSLRSDECIDDILHKYSNMVFRIAYNQTKNKADAEDVFQDVFMRHIGSNAVFESENHRKAWLIRVSINCCKSLLTSAWFLRTTSLKDDIAVEIEEKGEVYAAVLKLPHRYRIVVHLYYFEDMSISEISGILNKKENTIKSQLHRAREMLRQNLKGEFDYV